MSWLQAECVCKCVFVCTSCVCVWHSALHIMHILSSFPWHPPLPTRSHSWQLHAATPGDGTSASRVRHVLTHSPSPVLLTLFLSRSLSVFIYVAASFCISNHVADSIVASATVALYAKLLHDNASGCQKSQARDQGRTEGGRGACRLAWVLE